VADPAREVRNREAAAMLKAGDKIRVTGEIRDKGSWVTGFTGKVSCTDPDTGYPYVTVRLTHAAGGEQLGSARVLEVRQGSLELLP
jgi:hypothetical protein